MSATPPTPLLSAEHFDHFVKNNDQAIVLFDDPRVLSSSELYQTVCGIAAANPSVSFATTDIGYLGAQAESMGIANIQEHTFLRYEKGEMTKRYTGHEADKIQALLPPRAAEL